MKIKRVERRKAKRHSESFANIEERDAFIAKKFPILKPDKRSGYFSTPNGVKVSVWMSKVLWAEPVSAD